MAAQRICSVDGCGKRFWARDLCHSHYGTARYRGTITVESRSKRQRNYSLPPHVEFVAMALASAKDECILWPYAKSHNGYGLSNMLEERRVHRAVCRQVHGEPPDARSVAMHSCNVRECINPKHLSWGTQKQNVAQAREQGRMKWAGRKKGKLSDDDIRAIRRATEAASAIGARFGVSASYVWDIKQGRRCAQVIDAA